VSFVHGKNTAVAVGGYDVSRFLNEADATVSVDVAETSHFRTQAKTYLAGLDDGTYSLKGMFDGAPDGIDAIGELMQEWTVNETILPVCIGNNGAIAGSAARLGRAKVTGWETDSPVGDVVTIQGDLQATGGVHTGQVLMWANGADGAANGDDVQSLIGATPLLVVAHVANQTSGTVTVIVQHSDDGETWTDLVTFDAVASGTTAGAVGTAAIAKAHLRTKTTWTGTGLADVIVAASRN
jgi:hypothetical protein